MITLYPRFSFHIRVPIETDVEIVENAFASHIEFASNVLFSRSTVVPDFPCNRCSVHNTNSYCNASVGAGEQIGPYKLLKILGEGGYE